MADEPKKTAPAAQAAPESVPAARGSEKLDAELELYRDLIQPPTTYEDGFNLRTFMGVLFVAVIMMPTAIYLGLTMGMGLGPAAEWVTIILFADIARRSFKPLKRQELYMLFYVAASLTTMSGGIALSGGPFAGTIWNQYIIQQPFFDQMHILPLPDWMVPSANSRAIMERTFFDQAWVVPIMLMVAGGVLGRVMWVTMGYSLFRMTSDVEKLPFPMASISVGGATALAESSQEGEGWRWRVFSIGAMLGMAFGAIYSLMPLATRAIFGQPVMLLPIPWIDTTVQTEGLLPTAATGISTNLGIVIVGMVMPFWMVVGQFIAAMVHMFVSPLLYQMGILTHWRPGMGTIETSFMNSVDFWMSFGIGVSFAVAVLGIRKVVTDVRKARRERAAGISKGSWDAVPPGRGDFSVKLALGLFGLCSLAFVLLSWYLMSHPGANYIQTTTDIAKADSERLGHAVEPMFPLSGRSAVLVPLFLFFFAFLYTPLISYINARMIGLTGKAIGFPMMREATFILSGSKGSAIWCAPFPMHDYGGNAQRFREIELTGTKFTSIIKAELCIYPVVLIASFFFWQYVWHYGDPIPSASYPYAQKFWNLIALNQALAWSATAPEGGGGQSMFFLAFKYQYVLFGLGFGLAAFALLNLFKAPTLLFYGFVGGMGSLPHMLLPEMIGALLGRYYFAKLIGREKWMRYVPVLSAGFFCGVGLISMVGVALMLLRGCIAPRPY